MNDANNSSMPSSAPSVMRPTPSKTTSAVNGAAKVFREFKWGLLTLFLLMVVVIGLVYDGGKKKAEAPKKPAPTTEGTDLVSGMGPLSTDPTVPSFPADSTPPSAQNDTLNPGMTPTPGYTSTPGTNNTNPGVTSTNNANTGANGTTQPPVVYTGPVPTVPNVPGLVPPAQPRVNQKPVVEVLPVKPGTTVVAETASNVYVVQNGDTLSGISHQFFPGKTQTGIKAILAANKDVIPDANRLRPGMKLKIPGMPETASKTETKTEAGKSSGTTTAEKPKTTTAAEGTYTVQSGDTLERIARKVLNNGSRWNEIYEMNRDRLADPGRLRVGMQLKIKGLKETTTTEDAKPATTEKHPHPSTTAEMKEAKVEPATANTERVWMP